MKHPGLYIMLLVLFSTAPAVHAQVSRSTPNLSDQGAPTEVASVNLPVTQFDPLTHQTASPLASFGALQARASANAVRAEVLDRLGMTVRDTDLARLSDIYETR